MPLPPSNLTTCDDLPQIPAQNSNDLVIATFIDEQNKTAIDCKSTLADLTNWLQTTHAQIDPIKPSSKTK